MVQKVLAFLVATVALSLTALTVFYFGWVTHVEAHEMGFTFNRWTGEIEEVEKQGWVIRNPFSYGVHTVDLRPFQITITANLAVNQRVLNAKLVQFDPKGLQTFVAWHGRKAGESPFTFTEIMKCYAFDTTGGKDCPFIIVTQDTGPGQTGLLLDGSNESEKKVAP